MDEKSARSIQDLVVRSQERAGSATQLGTPADVSQPNDPRVCSTCGGTGWQTVNIGLDRRVTRCSCTSQERSDYLLAKARVPAHYDRSNLSTFRTDGPQKIASEALIKAQWFVERYPLDKTGLLILGPTGTGKTHLAIGAIKELILEKGISCMFYDYSELLKLIQNSYNPSVQTTELDVLRPVFEADVLVLDDFGASRPTEWVWDAVSLILKTRYNENRTVIITTNYPDGPSAKAEGVEGAQRSTRDDTLGDRVGDRMLSRIHEMCRIINMPGKTPDFRSGNTRLTG
ncbi:MAG: ATP-binding protein [Terriglobales bacterium]